MMVLGVFRVKVVTHVCGGTGRKIHTRARLRLGPASGIAHVPPHTLILWFIRCLRPKAVHRCISVVYPLFKAEGRPPLYIRCLSVVYIIIYIIVFIEYSISIYINRIVSKYINYINVVCK